ncbi:MAG TPA: histidine utilization repressor [Burkholderiaceae bacterium]|nr:histidine utilization repressor [Rhodoferax sp.]HNW01056.1 histidine utilization repressor [Burkholderiaceae bacterium]HPW08455.1 histidine utilization repressor [Burkholderiaceae bacterium]
MVFPSRTSTPSPPFAARAPYARVKAFLKEGLSVGRWTPGTLMPSESELVAQFQVSRMTVTRALRELQTEGLVSRVQGVGTFAAHLFRVSSSLTIRDLHEEIVARGHRHHAQVHLAQEERAADGLAQQLGVAIGASVFHTLIVHFENGVPLQCEDRYVNPACAPDYLQTDFTQITPTHYLLSVAPLWEAQYSIEAGPPSAREAELLGIASTDPCLIIVRRTINRDVPITLARLVHPGSRYQIHGQFKP